MREQVAQFFGCLQQPWEVVPDVAGQFLGLALDHGQRADRAAACRTAADDAGHHAVRAGTCALFDPTDFERLTTRYGSMRHLQTMGA